ncbi:glycosyltransferase family protein [Viscerimonas tarda]
MRKMAILIRVYDRIEDLKYNLQIIIDTWRYYDYYIIVVSNGHNDGFAIPEESKQYIDKLVVLETNAGHRKGNSQLLLEGIKHIPKDCEYTIILEADTWKYKDRLNKEYIDEMDDNPNVVWASADWYDKQYGLATDFAIIKTAYISNNPQLFDFDLYPECYIANYLRDTGAEYMWITENMPVHIPSYVFKYPYVNNSKEKRFYVFPKARMVTHHIEFLRGGIARKKHYFNVMCKLDYFTEEPVRFRKWEVFKMKFWIKLSRLFFRKSWISKKKYMEIEK